MRALVAALCLMGCGRAAPKLSLAVLVTASHLADADRSAITQAVITISGAETKRSNVDARDLALTGELHYQYVPGIASGIVYLQVDVFDAGNNLLGSSLNPAIPIGLGQTLSDPLHVDVEVPGECQSVTVSRLTGNGISGSVDGPATGTTDLREPSGVAVDGAGNVYVADSMDHRIRKVAPDGTTGTLAGNGTPGWFDGTGGATGNAQFDQPSGVAVDGAGNVYVADSGNRRIRKIAPDGTTSTLAGNGTVGYFDGTGGPQGTTMFVAPGARRPRPRRSRKPLCRRRHSHPQGRARRLHHHARRRRQRWLRRRHRRREWDGAVF
jgi:hypothetical protein